MKRALQFVADLVAAPALWLAAWVMGDVTLKVYRWNSLDTICIALVGIGGVVVIVVGGPA